MFSVEDLNYYKDDIEKRFKYRPYVIRNKELFNELAPYIKNFYPKAITLDLNLFNVDEQVICISENAKELFIKDLKLLIYLKQKEIDNLSNILQTIK